MQGAVRKFYDLGPAALTSNGSYNGSGTPSSAWLAGQVTVDNTGYCWLSGLSQSVNDNGRTGISVAAESLDLRVKVIPDFTVASSVQHLRMIVYADNEFDGVTSTMSTELLGNADGTATNAATGMDMLFLQPAYFGRFKILEDKNWVMYNSSTTNSWTTAIPMYHESHHDLKGHTILWDTTDTSGIADARKGHIFVAFFFTNTVVSTGGLPTVTTANPPAIHISSRLRYRDA